MNILIINFEFPPLGGGGGVATKQFAMELAKRHDVHVITTGYAGLLADSREEGVQVHRVFVWGRKSLPTASLLSMMLFVPAALWRGLWLCRGVRFKVINAQFVIPSGIPAALLAALFGIPLVVSFIGGDVYDPTKGISPHRHALLRWLVRQVSGRAKLCTAISTDTKMRVVTLHGVTCPITVTHLGYSPLPVLMATRAELGVGEGQVAAVSVGRLIPRKSYDVLLKAWQNIPDAHLYIIGDGPQRGALLRLIAELGLTERVRLLGYVSEVRKRQLLGVADLYVSAAEHEGFGIVFLEAMDAGLPIVATNDGGQRDFLDDGENALLVPAGDAAALAQAVSRLLADKELSGRLSGNNRARVEDFTIPKVTAVFEQVLIKASKV